MTSDTVGGETVLRGSFWPDLRQRALLKIALGPAAEAATRWRELQPLDVTKLEPGAFALLPLLYERLGQVVPGDPQLRRLLGTYRSIWYRNQLLLDRLAVLLPLLRQRAGVEPLLLGGMSALLRWYPRLGLRPVAQLELIVEREAAADAVKVAGYAGWRPSDGSLQSTRLRDQGGRALVIHHGPPVALAGPRAGEGLRFLREDALELEKVDGTPLVLDAGNELVFVCATGARNVVVRTSQWLVDAHRILGSPDAPSVNNLLERARRVHAVEPVRATLRYLADIGGEEALAGYVAAFEAETVSRRDRIAFTLAGVGGRRLGAIATAVATYLQATADDRPLRAAARLPRYLQARWETESVFRLPALALWKTVRLLAPSQLSPADRNRSASS